MANLKKLMNTTTKKALIVAFLVFILIIVSIYLRTKIEIREYKGVVEKFINTDVNTVNVKINNGDGFFLYVGRATCPWCRKLVTTLLDIVEVNNIELYYLDSENTEIDYKINDFRKKYNIEFVPSILYFNNNKVDNIDINITNSEFLKDILEKEILILVQ